MGRLRPSHCSASRLCRQLRVSSPTGQQTVPASPPTEQSSAPAASPSRGMLPSPPAALQDLRPFILPLGPGWYNALKPEFEKPYFTQLREFVTTERQWYEVFPRPEHVFSWAAGDPSDVKVVILGQDPYPEPGMAHGLSFSVLPGVPLPRSLDNIFKELKSDLRLKELESDDAVTFTRPGHGYLAGWARQGVLLLNTCLTVRSGEPNSHKNKGWEKFTDAVIRHIRDNQQHVVFMLWGNEARKKAAIIEESGQSRHDVLTSSHPSPLSADLGFFGCGHFSTCNQLLVDNHQTKIDWNYLPPW